MEDERAAGHRVLAQLGELPGGAALLELAGAREGVELTGGAVRDLLRGEDPREFDVVAGEDAPELAGELARALGGHVTVHERFGTALVEAGPARVDFAMRRAESYPQPGALPEVRPGAAEEDLLRRDFTVNAIAVAIGGTRAGEVRAAPHALEDLAARRLRVLHERSFLDDPTRLLRLARYAARLGFELEQRTAQLAAEAVAAGAIATVSGPRLGAELRLALAERCRVEVMSQYERLGLLRALHPRLRMEEALLRRALGLLPGDGRPDLLALAAIALPLTLRADGDAGGELGALLDRLEFQRADRDRAVASALAPPQLAERLAQARMPSELRNAAHRVPLEGVALAGALGAPGGAAADAAQRWLSQLRHVRLQITGDDLLRAGVPAGPQVGARLEAALRRRLDGELGDGAEAELAAALEAPA